MNDIAQRSTVIFIDLFLLILMMYLLYSHFDLPVFKDINLVESKKIHSTKSVDKAIILECKSNGSLLLNDREVSSSNLASEIKKNGSKLIFVGIDMDASWKTVAPVIEILSKMKEVKIKIAYESTN